MESTENWDMPFVDAFDLLGYRFRKAGKGVQGTDKTLREGMGSWWRDVQIYRAKIVSLRRKCDRMVSRVFSTALNGSVNWSWSTESVVKDKRWESKTLRLTLRPRMKAGERLGELQEENDEVDGARWRKMKLPTTASKNAEKIWKTMAWTNYDGDVPAIQFCG